MGIKSPSTDKLKSARLMLSHTTVSQPAASLLQQSLISLHYTPLYQKHHLLNETQVGQKTNINLSDKLQRNINYSSLKHALGMVLPFVLSANGKESWMI